MALFAADPDPWKVLASLATVVGLVIGLVSAFIKGKSKERKEMVKMLRKFRKTTPRPLNEEEAKLLRKLEMPEVEIGDLVREFESEYQRSLPPEGRSDRWSN